MLPIIVVTLPLMLVLPLVAYSYISASAQAQSVCGDNAMQEKVRMLMNDAVDQAFTDHVANLYTVWMKDDKGQPQRASSGIALGVNAYVHGRNAVANWSLKPCK